MLVPVIGLVQVGTQALADRFTYIPFMGLAMALGCDGAVWARRLRLEPAFIGAVGGLMLAACLVVTEWQLSFWSSNERLFERALAVTPDNPAAHANLGVAFEQRGQIQEAQVHYEAALRLMPNLAQVHNNLANLLDRAGETNAALAHFLEARRLKPGAPLIHANYGSMLVKLGRFDEAVAEFTEAARLSPSDPRPLYLWGKALLRQGHSAEARARLQQALAADSNHVPALVFLARLLATDADASLRNGPQAVVLAERANTLTGGEAPAVLDVLAMTYAEAGNFEAARATARKALNQAAAAGETNVVGELRERLELFESNHAFHQGAPGGNREP
jgi:Tfp pilus assembly protein PilF